MPNNVLNVHLFTKLIVNAEEDAAQPAIARRMATFITGMKGKEMKEKIEGEKGGEASRLENPKHPTCPSYTVRWTLRPMSAV